MKRLEKRKRKRKERWKGKRKQKRELEKKQKAEQREAEWKKKAVLRQTRNGRRQQSGAKENGLQSAEISSNECAVCLRTYEDDVVDGVLETEWIQCTNSELCGKWMHCTCFSKDPNGLYICHICKVTFS